MYDFGTCMVYQTDAISTNGPGQRLEQTADCSEQGSPATAAQDRSASRYRCCCYGVVVVATTTFVKVSLCPTRTPIILSQS